MEHTIVGHEGGYRVITTIRRAARQGDHRDPDRLSFTRSPRVVRRQVADQAASPARRTHPRNQKPPTLNSWNASCHHTKRVMRTKVH
ncbi:hypothetical protein [Streptomyces sp. NPDC001508]|uniref:hypothetical protein n=1 Tax=Streptomyces sp. NPDC001508 TaxID=3154656 RepID=UPI00331CA7E7